MDTTEKAVESRIRAWEVEITRYYFKGGKSQVNANKLPLICQDDLLEFDSSHESYKRVLVGGKGTGKSTALARKAVQLLDNGVTVVPSVHPHVMRLQAIVVEGAEHDFTQYEDHNCWVQIWKLAISTVFVASMNMKSIRNGTFSQLLACPMKKSAAEFFDTVAERILEATEARNDSISPILELIISRNYDVVICQSLFVKHIKARLVADENHAMIIDQIDEALGAHRESKSDTFGQSVWEAAQTGIVDAITDISNLCEGNFEVYAAIRGEAYRRYPEYGYRNQTQSQSFCLRIDYSSEHLARIFNLNVKLTHDSRLAAKDDPDPLIRFFGVRDFAHPHVASRNEDALQWLKRHTFGSPRELVYQGCQIHHLNPEKRQNRYDVAAVVNQAGDEIYRDYVSELVPVWRKDVVDAYPYLTHNVMSDDEAKSIDDELGDKLGFRPIEYLYSVGLIGIPMQKSSDATEYEQRFLSIPELVDGQALQHASFYVLHPCMYPAILKTLKDNERQSFHSHIFIPGSGLPCPQSIEPPRFYLLQDGTNQRIQISELDGDIWNPTRSQIRAGIKKDLSVDPMANVGPITFLALLFSMYKFKTNFPKVDQIGSTIDYFVESGYCPVELGKGATRDSARKYVYDQLMYEDNKRSHTVQKITSIAESLGLRIRMNSPKARLEGIVLEGITWTEIRRLAQ